VTESKAHRITPTTLRLLLSIALFLVATLAVVGFVFAQKQISAYALEVSHKKVDATASESSLQTLQTVEKQLADDQEIIKKASTLKHNSSLPQFKAIADLQNHAQANKISLSDISFEASSASTTAPATTTTPTPDTAAPAAPAAGISITFKVNDGEVATTDFVNFLYDIEHSTPKMQIKGISVKKGKTDSQLAVDSMTVTMLTQTAE
jgi:hypothetical protein